MDLNKVGKLIHDLRVEKGLSQAKLVELIPITRQAVSRWEQGKSLPDSQTLIILSEIFEISVDEILAGKRNSSEEQTKITLDLVDEYNNKKRTIRKITIISIIIIFSLLILFLGYYFFNSYNSIKVYTINGIGDNFISKDGIMITTKQKTYLRIGELRSKNKDYKIDSVKLYLLDENGIEKLLYKDNKTDILITSYYGYGNNLSQKELTLIKEGLFLDIEYEGKVETIELQIKKDFSNNLIFFNKKDKVLETENNKISRLNIQNKVKLSMEEKGKKDGGKYTYIVNTKSEKITFTYLNNELLVETSNDDQKKSWDCYFNNEFSFFYTKFVDGVEKEKIVTSIKNNKELSLEEEKAYDMLVEYINNYLIN